MVKYILSVMIMIMSSIALAYNVDDPNFWDGWKRDTSVETNVFNVVNNSRFSAQELIDYATEAHPEHAFYVGLLYYLGYHNHAGVPFQRDHKKALQYFQKVGAYGYLSPYVDYYMGMIMWNGYDGAPLNKIRAKTLLARANTPESFLMLTAMNSDNPNEQLIWYKKLAYMDDWRAILTVAHWYNIGRGTRRNGGEAYYWYNKACAQRVAEACSKLNTLHP
ncbi:tetratricopeptide repeat protein [Wohlfahrtiimonas populi]|uniref:tetratricopeptide repeat protein n=1 Tax=Wohlfahrtiimonas populi TaxID=1940240 RepID=UPI00098D65F2|nr:tetratricopeptide repeat protein [Wohlfahrtiimonas populi]